jgi:glycolate oxidase FAD binding subunit
VLGLRIVHADGAVTKGGGRVVKNASAYDMPRLYLGALGTLGVIAEATLRVYPRAQAESGAVFAFPDVSAAQSVADRILRSALAPTRLEIGAGATGLPACENGAAALAATFSGVPESVASQGTAVIEMAAAQGGVPVGLADLAGFLRGWQDFPWAEAPDGGLRALWRGGVLPSECGKAMEAVHHAAGEDCRAGTLATVSAGLLRGVLSAGEPGRLARCLQAARRALENLGGYLVVLDAPAPVGAPVDVWGAPPPSFSLMRDLRQAFDERGVLNPGRFLGL